MKPSNFLTSDGKIGFYLGYNSSNQDASNEYYVEPILNALLTYTSMTHSAFIRPFIILIIRMFPRENQIPQLYGFEIKDLDYYLLFSFVLIISQFIIDTLILNSLEILHGFKLFYYFSYCNFRYNNRKVKWGPHNFNLDKSIQIDFRSLDNLCFSSQFYFINTVLIQGICLVTISTSIIIRNRYNLFSDPAFLPIVFFFSFLILITKIAVNFISAYFFNFWKIKIIKEKPCPQILDRYLSTGEFKIESILESDYFRKHFVHLNKDWILNNLKHIIKKENFEDSDSYLYNLFNVLSKKQSQEQKELQRINVLKARRKLEQKAVRNFLIYIFIDF